jgi:hypothetical protein
VAKRFETVKRVLVIGGGVAGIQAALDCADGGQEVILVEREQTIGGKMAKLDKTFPTVDCSSCVLGPKMVDIAQHPNITLYACSEVESCRRLRGQLPGHHPQEGDLRGLVQGARAAVCARKNAPAASIPTLQREPVQRPVHQHPVSRRPFPRRRPSTPSPA